MMSYQVLALMFIAGGVAAVPAAQAARVTVTVEGIRTTDGAIMVGLFADPATFPDHFLRGQSAAAQVPSVTIVFENVEPGRYALSAFHDRNGNGKLDRGTLGIPKEPYGFSHEARGVMGPPSFDAAALEVPADGLALVIHLK